MTTEERFERIERNLGDLVGAQRINTKNLEQLTQIVSRFIDSADARMRRIEENLDALIRAITAEHSYGQGPA